jgi:hypothetical protein
MDEAIAPPRKEALMSSCTANIIRDVNQGKHVTLSGVPELALARAVLEYAVHAAGSEVVFDPASAPDLVDYLTVTATSALDGAAIGAGLGAAIGLILERPGPGAAIGLFLGLLAGMARGADRVERGWRVRAIRDGDGVPNVTVGLLESPWT